MKQHKKLCLLPYMNKQKNNKQKKQQKSKTSIIVCLRTKTTATATANKKQTGLNGVHMQTQERMESKAKKQQMNDET